MKKILVIFFTLISIIYCNAQSLEKYKDQISDAEYHFLNDEYEAALNIYMELLKDIPDNANINYRVGVCLLNLPFENGKSIDYLKKASANITLNYKEGSYKEDRAPIASLFYLGYAYHLNNFLDEAHDYYNKFRDTLPVDDVYNMSMVERQIVSVENAKEIKKNPIDIEISNLGHTINTKDAEYNPAVTSDGKTMIYTHDRPLEQVDSGSFYLKNLYREILVTTKQDDGKWSDPYDISKQLKTKGQCQTLSLSADGTKLLLYKDDWNDGGILDFKAGTIYISEYDTAAQKWSEIQPVSNEINTMAWETHACISPDGKSIYFSSDRKGGFGGLDIYVIHQDENGKWGRAQNLGDVINTQYDETTPYILADSITLYFSSEGHNNMGGYDVFSSKLGENNQWSKPKNVGYPINSTGDNVFFVPIKDGSTAFYSIERHEGYFTFGSKDIYQIDIFKDSKEELASVDSTVNDSILAVAQDSLNDSLLAINNQNNIDDTQAKKDKRVYTIRNIFYDFNSCELNREAKIEAEKLAVLMNENPSLYIELIGHTDSKGNPDYNKKLSLKRSKAVADYLVQKGIERTRFVTTGAGEDALIAKETVNGLVLKEGQQLNRRVEIKVLKTDKNIEITFEEQVPENLRLDRFNRYSIALTESETKIIRSKFNNLGEDITILAMQTATGFLYYFGNFKTKAEAVKSLNMAVSKGYNEAYIIDYFILNKKNTFVTSVPRTHGVKYTIQLKAIDKKILLDAKVKGITEQKTSDGFYRYTYKEFLNLQDAEKALDEVIAKGFTDAFIIESYKLR